MIAGMTNFTGSHSKITDGFSASHPLQIEIVTTVFAYTTLLAGLPYTQPAFDMALDEIRANYPNLNVSHHIISDNRILSCADWAAANDDAVASYFYGRTKGPNKPDLMVFILPGK